MTDENAEDSKSDKVPQKPEKYVEKTLLSSLEQRLVDSKSPQETILWTQVRGEIIRQNEESEEQNHRRLLEKIQLIFKMGFSIITFIVGTLLVLNGFSFVGLFMIGAGLYGLAPDFVKSFFKKHPRGKND